MLVLHAVLLVSRSLKNTHTVRHKRDKSIALGICQHIHNLRRCVLRGRFTGQCGCQNQRSMILDLLPPVRHNSDLY